MVQGDEPQFGLIVGAARSGTTLLRLLLDAHPEIGCPAEAGLPGLMSHMAQVWTTIDADIVADVEPTDPGQPGPEHVEGRLADADPRTDMTALAANIRPSRLPDPARDWIRAAGLAAMRNYCSRGHKRLYVDKSLDSVYYLELVRDLFPDVRCVLAFRHVMDTIASGIEASPWGFQAYGYAPYVQTTPGNTVAALARYWVDHVSQALEWEKEHPDLCIRLRYEDLVANPEEIISQIQTFLGVREDLSVLSDAFEREAARGPGDYKVEHTRAVHASSVGHGKRVPVDMLPPQLLTVVNEKLDTLGYSPLDRSWNTVERPMDAVGETIWSTRLRDLMARARPRANGTDPGVFALVAEDHRALRWIIDTRGRTIAQGDGEVESVITGTTEDLVLMLTDEENLGSLLRAGRIRHLVPDAEQAARPNYVSRVREIVDTLRGCIS